MLQDPFNYYSRSKFITSMSSLFKIAAMLMFIVTSIMFLSTPVCDGIPMWFGKIYPIFAAISAILIALLYAIFSIGIAKRGYRVWTLIDLIFNMLDFTAMLVMSIVSLTQCSSIHTSFQMIPGSIGIVGAVFLAVSATMWFVQNRRGSDLIPVKQKNTGPHIYRKSVMV